MTTMNWLTLVGAPAIVLSIITGVFTFLFRRTKAIKLGIQAMLRDRLYQLYHYCKRKGERDTWDSENFENMYKQYHNLGANGVMDDVHSQFFAITLKDV